jgi:hypothetical protein
MVTSTRRISELAQQLQRQPQAFGFPAQFKMRLDSIGVFAQPNPHG